MITFNAPYDNPAYAVSVRNPEFNDNLILDTMVSFYKAMDGTNYGYKKTPALKKHHLVFKELSRRQTLELIQFLQDSAGDFVRYIDMVGHVWKGLILTDPVEAETYGNGRSGFDTERAEASQITVEFEGVLIS